MKFHMRNKIVIIITIVVICSLLLLFCYRGQQNENKFHTSQSNSYQSVNSYQGVICFYEETNVPGRFAIGMIVKNERSIVFLWDKTTNITEIKVDYKPVSEEELLVFKSIVNKTEASIWTGNRIVPCDLNKTSNNTYTFGYYDGWAGYWQYGAAIFYISNQTIEWLYHVKG